MSNNSFTMTKNPSPTDAVDRIPIAEEPFSVVARVAMQIGRESISSSIVAITELVKNAYDADAERVRIRFADLNKNTPMMVIEDDGVGMTLEQLRSRWLTIGTPDKLNNPTSRKKSRVRTGEKGLGRLGLDRLSEQTVIYTRVEGEDSGAGIDIDWRQYDEFRDERLDKVRHQIFKFKGLLIDPISEKPSALLHGTQLVLLGLKDNWDEQFFKTLKKELELLVSPFAGLNDFAIELDSGLNLSDVDGPTGSEEALDAAEWTLAASIDAESQVSYLMTSKIYSESYHLTPTPWQEKFKDATYPFARTGPLELKLYFYARRSQKLGELGFDQKKIINFLDANQGIRIYRDRFRVNPYGKPDGSGDWLNLSFRRQQSPGGVTSRLGEWRVGYNQVVGAVFIGRNENPGLVDQTNREGIVEAAAFDDLKRFALDAIQFFEINRQRFELSRVEKTDFEKTQEEALSASETSAKEIDQAKAKAENIRRLLNAGQALPPKAFTELVEIIENARQSAENAQERGQKFAEAVERQNEEFQRQKDTLGNLASLGILTASFGHETLGASNVVLMSARQLNRNLRGGMFMVDPNLRQDIEDSLTAILYDSEKIHTFADFALKNVRRDKRKRKAVHLNDVTRKVFSHLGRFLDERRILVDLSKIPKTVSPILAFQIDWESILVNLIANAVWALEVGETDSPSIRVAMSELDGVLTLTFADSGCGLERGTEGNIFLPTFSTKRNTKGEIIGTGMGLAIVKQFVESYQEGSVAVTSPSDLGGAEFTIALKIPDLVDRGRNTKGGTNE